MNKAEWKAQLSILQYNVAGSRIITNEFFESPMAKTKDIVALQEPYWNKLNGLSHNPANAKAYFNLVFDVTKERDNRPRVSTYISKRIPRNQWKVSHLSRFVHTIRIETSNRTLYIHNVYNSPDDDQGIDEISTIFREIASNEPNAEHVLIGDFNTHSPRWGGIGIYTQKPGRAAKLYEVIDNYGLQLLLKRGTITRKVIGCNPSTLDLSFGTSRVEETLIYCLTHPPGKGLDKGSDHAPVETNIDFSWEEAEEPKRRC